MSFLSVVKSIFKHGFNDPWLQNAIDKSGLGKPFESLIHNTTQDTMTGAQREQNEWTAQREDTANQRAVADMQAAGLNPALMYGHGTASSSSPAASASPASSGIMDLMSLMMMPLQMKSLNAQIRNTHADTQEKVAKADLAFAEAWRNRKTLDVDLALKDAELLNKTSSTALNDSIAAMNKAQLDKILQDTKFAAAFFGVDMEIKRSIVAQAYKGMERTDAEIEKWRHENKVSDAQVEAFAAKTLLDKSEAVRIMALLPHEIYNMDSQSALNFAKTDEARASIQQAWVALGLQRAGLRLQQKGLELKGLEHAHDMEKFFAELGLEKAKLAWVIASGEQSLTLEDERNSIMAASAMFGGVSAIGSAGSSIGAFQ